jgi:CDP-diacylglycerol--glycerol-3-phosphate 3-phosphatidyltransferase
MFKFLKNINLPTKITLVRILVLPLILFFYISPIVIEGVGFFENWGKFIALILFVAAAATDWLDGYIARKYNMVTNTGKLLDPVADKMLTVLGFLLIVSDPVLWNEVAFPYWFAVTAVFIALGRDIVMNSLRFIAAEQGIVIAADSFGKIKSTMQYIAIALYMLFAFNYNWAVQFIQDGTIWYNVLGYTCVFVLTFATILSVWSCANYVINYGKAVMQKTAGSAGTKEKNYGTDKN